MNARDTNAIHGGWEVIDPTPFSTGWSAVNCCRFNGIAETLVQQYMATYCVG